MFEPIDPRERRKLHRLQTPPRALPSNYLRLEEPNQRLGEGIVIRITTAAHGRRDAGVGEAIGVPHRQILRAAVAVMHQAREGVAGAVADGLLERIQHEVRAQGRRRHASPTIRREKTSITNAT